ncbi:MAG: SIS domain-containing protein [Candidatus Omnitrophica bacterium]|nr:SIS domain-containing protein [Candidatus Omnitrophota bacterium]
MRKKIAKLINEDIQVKRALLKGCLGDIEGLARKMCATVKAGNKIIVFGNGGSAADSIHFAAELVGRFRKERAAIPAIALPANISTLTALGNDYDFGCIFERQIAALGKKGDLALGISTSGKSENVIRGIRKASMLNLKTAVLTGRSKSRLSKMADFSIRVPSDNTPRIQEAHITIIHILCEIIEDSL